VLRNPGDRVFAGDAVAIVEAMKTEISVTSDADGVVREVRVASGAAVQPGQVLAVLE
jgi:biotin carboxyl carrier protein